MGKIVDLFINDVGSIRTGRATPGLIENVMVVVYGGQKMRLIELGSISAPDVRSLTFQPWDMALIREIANGISAANIGMQPVVDGELIRMSLPPLTVEQREDFVKLLGRKLEGVRDMVRTARADFRKKIMDAKNDKEIGEDERFKLQEYLEEIMKDYNEKIKEVGEKKEEEINTI